MNNHRINELIELLHNAWKKDPELSLLQFIGKLSAESGFKGNIEDISDNSLIYNLKMRESADDAEIPGLKKDYETDFKTAILRARGVIKD